jgi:two-component system sensor histidine kinase BaeS
MRRSLVARLLIAVVAVALVAVLGTVWLTRTTQPSYSIEQAGTNLEADVAIVDELLDWGGSHATWDDVGPLVHRLAREHGRRIAVVEQGRTVVDTRPGLPHPDHARTEVDPWQDLVDQLLAPDGSPGTGSDDLTPLPDHLSGALALDDEQRAESLRRVSAVVECLGLAPETSIGFWPTGRAVLDVTPQPEGCGAPGLAQPIGPEQRVLDQLTDLTDPCLIDAGLPPVDRVVLRPVRADPAGIVLGLETGADPVRRPAAGDELRCVAAAFTTASAGSVAPSVEVFLTDERGDQRGALDLSPGSQARIALVSAVVVTLVLATAGLVGVPAVRRVRSVTRAARELAAGDLSVVVPVRGGDEVSDLARAFNTMAAELARAREQQQQMVADVSHELRTPLTTLRGWLEGAQEGVVPTDAHLVDLLHGETMHLQQITADLHTLTRADSGHLVVRPEPTDVAALLLDAPDGLVADVDPGRVRQVVDNLVANAVQHSKGSRVDLRASQVDGALVLEVVDDGVGISAEDLPRLFDRFWRADDSRTKGSGGSGLGLAISRTLVELHRGTLTAASVVGGGTVFTATFPGTVPRGGPDAPRPASLKV